MDEMAIDGAWVVTPRQHADERGVFVESYRCDVLAAHDGAPLALAQSNISVSNRGVVRGIHFVDVPPGQAKYVTCVAGAVLDVVVDVRLGSPTFGRWDAVRLDDDRRRAVYLRGGLGHGFCALTERATVVYMTSSLYDPSIERAIHPLDPQVGIAWPAAAPVLSGRDDAAPSLDEVRRAGQLPVYRPG